MNKKIKEIEDTLPKDCCSLCTHLTLDGPDEFFKYEIKCVIKDCTPSPKDYCEYFEPEHNNLNTSDLDNLYLNFLESCLRVRYEDYLNSMYWKLSREQVLYKNHYRCSICHSNENVEVYHLNKKFGRETEDDVILLCSKCLKKDE